MFYNTEMCSAEAMRNPLETLIRTIERFVEVPTLELTPAELGDHLVRHAALFPRARRYLRATRRGPIRSASSSMSAAVIHSSGGRCIS
jgi:hypothetical protein